MVRHMNYSAIDGTLYLKQAYQKNMMIALAIGVTLHLAVLGAYVILSSNGIPVPPDPGPIVIETFGTSRIQPPPDYGPPDIPINIARPTIPLIGTPEPVDDFDAGAVDAGSLARSADIQTLDRIVTGPGGAGGSGYGPIDVRIPGFGSAPPIDSLIVVDREPEIIHLEKPVYPELARKAGFEATLIVRVLIDIDGNPVKATIMKSSSTDAGFEQAVMDAALKGKWTPAMMNNMPVMCWVSYTVRFNLD